MLRRFPIDARNDSLKFFQIGWLTAWVLGLVAIMSGGVTHGSRAFLSLILPAGMIITLLGALTVLDYGQMRKKLDEKERQQTRRWLILPLALLPERGFGLREALMVLVIGVGWTMIGVGTAFFGMH